MSNLEKYTAAFTSTFLVDESTLKDLKYQDIAAWDSVGHMGLMTTLEETFAVTLDIDDVIEFGSFVIGKEILKKYGIEI
ncbi:acyl carrier protein [Polynucleobacter paneuropaeus]|jgi:acyl carrier protein|nr:acyl carrier protein [Polynucleobacter paneuropaeus]